MGPSSRARLSIAAVITVLVLGAGCSSSSDDSSATTTTTTAASSASTTTLTTEPAEPVDVSSGDLPPTPVSFVLDQAGFISKFDEFDPEVFGVPAGSVTAAWYRTTYGLAVWFGNLTLEQATNKCLGAWANAVGGYGAGGTNACAYRTIPPATGEPAGSVYLCAGGSIILMTGIALPPDSGDLTAQIIQNVAPPALPLVMRGDISAGTYPDVPAIDLSGCPRIG